MKSKGVSVIENSIEKIVLAVALVIFLAVFAVQFLASPTVDLPGSMGTVPLEQAEQSIADAANIKINQLESVGGTDNIPQPVNISQELIAAFNNAVDRPVQLAALVPSWPSIGDISSDVAPIGPTGDAIYAMPTPVAPSKPIAAVTMGTVDPSVPLLYPEVADLLPEQQPMDKAIVTAQVEWDAAANRLRMGAQSDGDSVMLPQDWRNAMEIWDIELVRREMGSDGSWGGVTVVPPMPGRASLRDRLAGATPPDIASLQSEEQNLRAGIRQPRMYNLIAGDFWMAPALIKQEQEMQRPAEVDRLLRQVRSIRSEIASLQRRLDNLGGGGGVGSIFLPPADHLFDLDSIDPQHIRWPDFADTARAQMGGGGSGGGGGGGGDRPREDPSEAQRRALQERLDRLQGQLDRAIERLEALGYDADGNLIGEEGGEEADFGASANLSATASATQSISIWAHDLTVEPGKTYQYAVRLKLRNPLFGQASSVAESQQQLASQPVVDSEMSEWSEPVFVPNLSEYFVVNASDSAPGLTMGTGPTATVETYRYFYGTWRRGSIRLNTGDSLQTSIQLPEALPIYELQKPEGEPVELVEESTLEQSQLEFSRSVYLLDVVAGVEEFITAYFRGDNGGVVMHEPAVDRNSSLLSRIRASIEEGEQEIRALDLTDSQSPSRPGRPPSQPGPGDDGGPAAPGVPAGPAGPAGPASPGSPFG